MRMSCKCHFSHTRAQLCRRGCVVKGEKRNVMVQLRVSVVCRKCRGRTPPTYSTAPSLGQLRLQCAVEGGHSIGCVDQSGEGMWFAHPGHWLKRDSPEQSASSNVRVYNLKGSVLVTVHLAQHRATHRLEDYRHVDVTSLRYNTELNK